MSNVADKYVGGGPSALILSYILHGNVPFYDSESPHPDPILHAKLKDNVDLLLADVDHLTDHFLGSRFSYSTQALPVNVLLDTLLRPYGETDESDRKTCVRWVHDPSRAVPHVVIGNTKQAGGQWVDNPVKASWDIGALSYAGMLSLPGYSFEQFYQEHHGSFPQFYLRPTRRDITAYFATYPSKVGIANAFSLSQTVSGVSRYKSGFRIASHNMHCNHLILGSGIFTKLVAPRPLLQPLSKINENMSADRSKPILVVGSGFSAADVILTAPRDRGIIHIYKWAPSTSPSPLRACHQQAYPEYAGVYRKMKLAATTSKTSSNSQPRPQRRTSEFDVSRNWAESYEGLPNTAIIGVEQHEHFATVTLQAGNNAPFTREIGAFAYVTGRRGSIEYLDEELRKEVCPDSSQWANLTGTSLREKAGEDLEIANNVYIIGSLTGDSLIRFAYGGCAYAAGRIIAQRSHKKYQRSSACGVNHASHPDSRYVPVLKGLQGHDIARHASDPREISLDRRKSEICVESS